MAKAELAAHEQTASRAAPSRSSKPSRNSQQAKPPLPQASSAAQPSAGGSPGTSEEPARVADALETAVSSNTQAADWAGVWKGKDTTRFQIPTFPSEPMNDDQARIRVDASGTEEIRLVLIDSSNDQDLCSLTAKLVPPNHAEIAPGQPCFGSEDESFELSVHVRSGTAKLQGSALSVDIALDAEVTSDQVQAKGSVEYHFEGKH